jgi:hypothetical protein
MDYINTVNFISTSVSKAARPVVGNSPIGRSVVGLANLIITVPFAAIDPL